MVTVKIGEGKLAKQGENIETSDLIIAKEADKNGAYVASFKVAALPRKPVDEFEREKLFREALEGVKRSAAKLKAAFAKP